MNVELGLLVCLMVIKNLMVRRSEINVDTNVDLCPVLFEDFISLITFPQLKFVRLSDLELVYTSSINFILYGKEHL